MYSGCQGAGGKWRTMKRERKGVQWGVVMSFQLPFLKALLHSYSTYGAQNGTKLNFPYWLQIVVLSEWVIYVSWYNDNSPLTQQLRRCIRHTTTAITSSLHHCIIAKISNTVGYKVQKHNPFMVFSSHRPTEWQSPPETPHPLLEWGNRQQCTLNEKGLGVVAVTMTTWWLLPWQHTVVELLWQHCSWQGIGSEYYI